MQGYVVLLLLSPMAVCSPVSLPVDCQDLYNKGFGHSGVYTIYPAGQTSAVQVYCDMGCEEGNGGKWTVCMGAIIQRRQDGTINFYRGWDQYRAGFGQASGEYWMGLENIHLLTSKKTYELRVEMEDFTEAKAFVQYSSFSVGPEETGYTLTFSGFKDGGAGAAMEGHNGKKFSTFDKDQDTHNVNCAKNHQGGWWYGECHSANPNGAYLWGDSVFGIGINWASWKGYNYSLKYIAMMIRPVQQ